MRPDMPETATREKTILSILFIISIAHLLNDMVQSIIPSIYPVIKDKYGFTFGQIGIITLVFQMTSSILQPFVGRFADRHPQPFSLSTGMVFTLLGCIMLSVANSYSLILVAVGVIGCGSSIFHPEASRIAQMAAGGKKGLAQSIFQVGGNGGSAIGPLLAAVVVIPFGQPSIAWFSIVALIAGISLIPVGKWYKKQIDKIKTESVAPNPAVLALSSRKIHLAIFILCILTFSKYFYMASMTFFLIDKFGIDIKLSQLCLFAFMAAVAAGTVIGGSIGDRYGRKYVIWGSILGAAPFALALPYVNFTCTIILAVIIGLVISSAFSAILVYATELKPDKIGMMAGLFFGLNFGLGGIGSAFFGWLADKTSIEFIFQISTLLPLLGIITAFLPDIEHKNSARKLQ